MIGKRKIGKTNKKYVVSLVIVGILLVTTNVSAFFNRGFVTVTLGQHNVSATVGENMSVTVGLDPYTDSHPPGCGMVDCPDACGPTCLDSNGNCTCAGSEYITYKTKVTVSSSNPSVANASYSDGILNILSVSPGTATITVTGILREWTNGTDSITVNVMSEPEQEENQKPEQEENQEPESLPEENQELESLSEENQDQEQLPENEDDNKEPDGNNNDEENLYLYNDGTGNGNGTYGGNSGASSSGTNNKEIVEALKEQDKMNEVLEAGAEIKVPDLDPLKKWKVYTIEDDKGIDNGSGYAMANPYKKQTVFTGIVFILAGIIFEYVSYRRKIR